VKFKEVVYYEVDWGSELDEFNQLVTDTFGIPFNLQSRYELPNDTLISITITSDDIPFDSDISAYLKNEDVSGCGFLGYEFAAILWHMAHRGIIPFGNYIFNISW